MKYGKFVAQKSIELNQKEKDFFFQYFMNMINNHNIPVSFDKMEKTTHNTYILNFNQNQNIIGKNIHKERITGFSGLFITINKNIGFLDVTDWNVHNSIQKDFDNVPPFQYSITMNVVGKLKPYRKKTEKHIFIPNSYQYGTEFSDFNFNENFKILKEKLTIQ